MSITSAPIRASASSQKVRDKHRTDNEEEIETKQEFITKDAGFKDSSTEDCASSTEIDILSCVSTEHEGCEEDIRVDHWADVGNRLKNVFANFEE